MPSAMMTGWAEALVIAVVVIIFLGLLHSLRHEVRPWGQTNLSLQRYHEWLESERRAESLLRQLLTKDEYRQLNHQGFLAVSSPNHPRRVYRIPRRPGQVSVFENGKLIMNLCVQPTKVLPAADVVGMHKLMIQGNEPEYLQVANRISPAGHHRNDRVA